MKKKYECPSIAIANVQLQKMVAASETINLSSTDYDGTTAVESRGFGSIWDDDED